jgi:hypothetical protein
MLTSLRVDYSDIEDNRVRTLLGYRLIRPILILITQARSRASP